MGSHVQNSALLALPSHALYRAGFDRERDARRGVDETTYSSVSDFGQYLQHPENRKHLDFELKHGGYDTIDHQATNPSKVSPRTQMQGVGWEYRKRKAQYMSRFSIPEGSLKDDP